MVEPRRADFEDEGMMIDLLLFGLIVAGASIMACEISDLKRRCSSLRDFIERELVKKDRHHG